ncbi:MULTISPECIES: hypothetical protein [Chloroflexus]|jgi:hypothetical protein|uniref:Uncharacterized protein n=2 Tax=Chloroflexus aggregans TaxID=152260 RepID=B8G7U6_CHLAD|nr:MULTISPECIES: hypothetical protein [Chloroflexus]ACL24125.1 conserved hypothetical protein [Chloroflexus aggregans DSM 9485]GIV90412.1 MAG: hypothetical protein KatS3mg055_2930 [Chloroflexus sp.]
MQLLLRSGGQQIVIDMERADDRPLVVGQYTYRPRRLAGKVRRLATKMWPDMPLSVLDQRLTFEAVDNGRETAWGDSGSFSPRSGSTVLLGRWDEDGSVGIALHELAHEMHLRHGGYDDSDGVVREALAMLAEREAGLRRTFEREPYHSACQLIEQLESLSAFNRMSFSKRWAEVVSVTSAVGLADLIHYYLDRSERLGLARWLDRLTKNVDVRDQLLARLANTSLRYSLELRRHLIKKLVRCKPETPVEQLLYVLDSIATLDRRYPNDDLERIINFCFAPYVPQRRRLFAFGS